MAENVSNENRLLAALAYPIWIIALIIVVTDIKKDPFMKHHGWIALFWGIAWLVIWFVLQVIAHIPLLGWLLNHTHGPDLLANLADPINLLRGPDVQRENVHHPVRERLGKEVRNVAPKRSLS